MEHVKISPYKKESCHGRRCHQNPPDFTIWKLHSFKEILIFFLVLATGLVVFRWKWLQMKKARTPEMAMKRVKKAIREGSHKKNLFLCAPKRQPYRRRPHCPSPGKALLLRVIHKATASMVIIRIPHGV